MTDERDEEAAEEARKLFREAMRNVRPLEPRAAAAVARRPSSPPSPPPRARFSRAARAADAQIGSLTGRGEDLAVEGSAILSFRRPGVPESVLRRLRRGQTPVEAEIDLHGLTAARGEAVLRDFLANALARGVRCVRIVHGKGQRSGERGPVLKATVNALLRRSPPVLAFTSAERDQGGTGATCVLLARALSPAEPR